MLKRQVGSFFLVCHMYVPTHGTHTQEQQKRQTIATKFRQWQTAVLEVWSRGGTSWAWGGQPHSALHAAPCKSLRASGLKDIAPEREERDKEKEPSQAQPFYHPFSGMGIGGMLWLVRFRLHNHYVNRTSDLVPGSLIWQWVGGFPQ